MIRRLASIGVLSLALVLLGVPQGMAADNPTAFITDLLSQGIRLIGADVPPAQRTAQFRDLFQRDFDVPGIGRFVLGRYWRDISPDQQQEFLVLFGECMVASYSDRLGQYGDVPYRIVRVRTDGEETVVTTEFTLDKARTMEIDWNLNRDGDQYKITDVAIAGVSMKLSLRDEFADIIQRNHGHADSILAVLRQQLMPAARHSPYG